MIPREDPDNKWIQFLKLINKTELNGYIHRKDLVKKKYNNRYSTIDDYRNLLTKIGVLEKFSRGVYIKRKNIKPTWSLNDIKEIAYSDTWKSWFIKFD